jgi:membrane fusion protein, heavy metal efflux system
MNKLNIVSLALLASMWACSSPKTESTTTAEAPSKGIQFSVAQLQKMPVEVGQLEEIQMDGIINANGVVDVPPDNMFMISYPIAGFVSKISHNLLPGRFIKKGELLATIQSLELLQLQEEYLNETTKNEFLVQEFARQKSLLADEATAKRKLQEVENNLKINQLKIRSLSEKLQVLGLSTKHLTNANLSASHQIFAQQNGYIKTVNVSNGKNFGPADVLFEIINTSHMHVELQVFGEDMKTVKLGQKVIFEREAESNYGEVYLIDKTVDPEKKSLNIHVHLQNEAFESSLKPGQYISAKIHTAPERVRAVKEAAVLSTSEGNYCFIMVEDKNVVTFKKVEVKTGKAAAGYIQILNPAVLQGKIVTRGVNFIENGAAEE